MNSAEVGLGVDSNSEWQKCALWKTLASIDHPEARAVAKVVEGWMPAIELILAKGGTSAPDFTLHDPDHSRRVAEKMAEIIPIDVVGKLSAYYLALLLLSAYLHDVGMTPERRKVSSHYQYLLTGDAKVISDEEKTDLQKWLDDEEEGLTPPITQKQPTLEDLQKANELITYYCRYRHNDWSAEWIRKNAPPGPMGTYVEWVEDLVRLCRSHHEGRTVLETKAFDPRVVGQRGLVVHFRYLACVLRVADVCDLDPERTPEVVLRHRDIAPESLIYWHKDHAISITLSSNGVVLNARPKTAHIHRASEETLNQIDQELQLCRSLADDMHFGVCPGFADPVPYRWDLPASAHATITPLDNAYEYIDGAFRPNTRKLLELLSGIELYGNPLVAVRELLQNAFDAVRERIAYERLRKPNPGDPGLEKIFGDAHRVELRLERRSDGLWLICVDDGVGMTKSIIADYLLVSGKSRRHEILDLERRCEAAGFALYRTGQFGIGVLSYFMIADRLVVATRRASETRDADSAGWRFETEGIGAFCELRRDEGAQHGTRVELRLRPEFSDASSSFYQDLRKYLLKVLRLLPCEFQLATSLAGGDSLFLDPGWTSNECDASSTLLEKMDGRAAEKIRSPVEFLAETTRKELEEKGRYLRELTEKAKAVVRWKVRSGDLPQRLGRFRIRTAYFDLPRGGSYFYFRTKSVGEGEVVEHLGRGYIFAPVASIAQSWKGIIMNVRSRGPAWEVLNYFNHDRMLGNTLIEIDFANEVSGKLNVDRNSIALSEAGEMAIQVVKDEARQLARSVLADLADSPYAMANVRRINDNMSIVRHPLWLVHARPSGGGEVIWGKIEFPATSSLNWADTVEPESLMFRGRPVSILRGFGDLGDDNRWDGVSWVSRSLPPDKIVASIAPDGGVNSVIPLWERNPYRKTRPADGSPLFSAFPPAWGMIAGIEFQTYYAEPRIQDQSVWNSRHPAAKAVTAEGWLWSQAVFRPRADPLDERTSVLASRERAACWLLYFLWTEEAQLWEGIVDRDQGFLSNVWKLVFGRVDVRPILLLRKHAGHPSRISSVTPSGWTTHQLTKNQPILQQYLPNPGAHWIVRQSRRSKA